MKIDMELAYGKGALPLKIEGRVELVTPPSQPPGKDPASIIKNLFKKPLASPPLKEIIRPGSKTALVVSDHTRVTGSKVFLPLLVKEVEEAGVSSRDITIIIATGMHRSLNKGEIEDIVGKDIMDAVEIAVHDAEKERDLVYVGTTSRGTPVKLNKHYMEAHFKILTGSIVYHYFAGFGGGRKSIIPGIASRDTILANHMLVFDPAREEGVHPKVYPGSLEGNPVHEDMLESTHLAPPDFILNTILDIKGHIVDGVGGNYERAHLAGCHKAKETFSAPIKEKADLVIASCGGHPKDLNMIQIQKTLFNVSRAVKEGGTIILLAECSGGMGSDRFLHWFDYPDPGKAEKVLRKKFELNGFTALSVMNICRRNQVIFLSQLPDETVQKMRMEPAKNLEEALQKSKNNQNKASLTYIMPWGSTTVPVTSGV